MEEGEPSIGKQKSLLEAAKKMLDHVIEAHGSQASNENLGLYKGRVSCTIHLLMSSWAMFRCFIMFFVFCSVD